MISFAVLVVEIWVLAALALIFHRANPRFGLTPLLFYVSALMAILNFAELLVLYLEPVSGIVLRTGGHVFVPVILTIVLVLYIADGTHPAQVVIWCLTGVNILILIVLAFLLIYQNVREVDTMVRGLLTQETLITPGFLRGVVASTITFLFDMSVIAVIYQGVQNAFQKVPKAVSVGLALTGALWTDSIVFNLLYYLGTTDFIDLLPGDIVTKTLAALIIWPLVAWYLVRVAPRLPGYVGPEGRPTLDMVFGTLGRVSRALQELQAQFVENQAVYRQLTENITEMFWMSDQQMETFLYLNPAFEVITGRSRSHFYHNTSALLDILHPEDRQRISENWPDYLYNTPEDEFRIIHKDGQSRWVRNRIFSIYNQQGKPYRLVGLAEDITERKRAETQAMALFREQEKVRLLHDFMRDASHDLRTPLAVIQIKIDLLQRSISPQDRERHLQELHERTLFLTQLIDDLFTLTRLDGDTITMSPVEIDPLLREICEAMQPLAANTGLALRLDNQFHFPVMVMGDEAELNRAFTNLITNAIRYCPEGSVIVRAFLNSEDRCVVEVEDTGIGMKQTDIPHIFERFYRAANARDTRIEGTGLGLSIVQTIIRRHRGKIDVVSEINRGTTFRVSLPLTSVNKNREPDKLSITAD